MRIVILHPFPTSWDFIKEVHKLGFEVWSTSTEGLHIPEDVFQCISRQLRGSVYEPDALAREIGDAKISLFYPGSEMAVVSAAVLSKIFGLPGNSVETAIKSRYKDLMRQELERVAPNHIPKYAIITGRTDLTAAAAGIDFPAVFKRTDFAGSFGIKIVRNMQELEKYFDEQSAIKKLSYDQPVRPIYLLEEFIEGQEFSVESVTVDGVTTVLGVTKKTVAAEPYFVEAKHEFPAQFFGIPVSMVESLKKLAKEVTEAMGFQFCVSHFEAKWDNKANRPIVVEVASRTGGDNIPKLLKYVIGMHTWFPIVAHLLGKSAVNSNLKFTGAASAQFAFLKGDGIFEGISNLEEIRAHPAHKLDLITGEIGEHLSPTFTYLDRVGCFIGYSSDVEVLKDYQCLASKAKVLVQRSEGKQ